MESSGISKKEYLKKYLSGGEKKKKKKKSSQATIIKSKIVDDDIDLKNMKPLRDDDLEIFDLAEEAPQIVGIIDDRPEEVRLMSQFRGTKKWKIVTDEYGIEDVKVTAIDQKASDDGPSEKDSGSNCFETTNSLHKQNVIDPKNIKTEPDSDSSSTRNMKDNKNSRSAKRGKDSSPVRRKEVDSDASPPRKTRRSTSGSDLSPPRIVPIKKEKSARDRNSVTKHQITRNHRNYDSDSSPPRRRKNKDYPDKSPPRRNGKDGTGGSSKAKMRDSSFQTNERSSKGTKFPSGDSRKPGTGEYGLKLKRSHNCETDSENKNSRLEKTLSGKKAGLQSAEDMRKESAHLKRKEKELFEKMPDEMTGRNAEAIVRNRKTGRRRDAREEARKKREKEEKEAEKIAQYAVWGKGVKQIQDRQDQMKDEEYEMSKPLARYKDDKDLDEMLKNQEREGDPMLEYIRRKRKSEPKVSRPQYEGLHLPNRYDIKPGHKWDGVDRSNGYEKKWFDEQNAKKAREEEVFKWSTEDM